MRYAPPFALLLACSLVTGAWCKDDSKSTPERNSPERKVFSTTPTKKAKELRQREGSKLMELHGRFQLSGDRVIFVPNEAAEGVSYPVLENLALERVLDNLNESRTERLWTISGTLTEFRNANHLLLSKAVIQATEAKEE